MHPHALLTLIPVVLLAACTNQPAGETPISQEARDAYQDKRLDDLETRVDALEAALRRQAAAPAPAPAVFPSPDDAESEDPPAPTATPAPTMAVELLDVSARAGETNTSWTRFGWKATVKSHLDRPLTFTLIVKFVDVEGYVLDTDQESVILGAGEERTVTGEKLVSAKVVFRVANVAGELKL